MRPGPGTSVDVAIAHNYRENELWIALNGDRRSYPPERARGLADWLEHMTDAGNIPQHQLADLIGDIRQAAEVLEELDDRPDQDGL